MKNLDVEKRKVYPVVIDFLYTEEGLEQHMKELKINFSEDNPLFFERSRNSYRSLIEKCNKWKDRSISITDFPELVEDFGDIVFTGKEVIVNASIN
jgi:hypothetical protein